MRVFASQEQPQEPGGCPSLEELAAYIDGALSKDERNRVAGHVATCERCYEVYSEVVRFQLDTAPAEDNVVPFPDTGRRVGAWLPWAVAAVLLLGLGFGFLKLRVQEPKVSTPELVASLGDEPSLGPQLWRGPTNRGVGKKDLEWEQRVRDQQAFQIGVQLVNLQVALQVNDRTKSSDVLIRLVDLLKNEIFLDAPLAFYNQILGSIHEGQKPRTFVEESSVRALEVEELMGSAFFDLGRWTEAGRLAAIAQEPAFFEEKSTRQFLRFFLWQQRRGELKLEAEALQSLRRISETLGELEERNLRESDYEALRQHFEAILQTYYRQPPEEEEPEDNAQESKPSGTSLSPASPTLSPSPEPFSSRH